MPQIFVTPGAGNELSPAEQISLAGQARLRVQNILARRHFNVNFELNTITISKMLEEIAQNISKMDQNLYSTKANMEEILHTSSSNNEFVALK